MPKLFDRVKVNIATAGTGTVTFGSVSSNAFLTPTEAGCLDADTVRYVIVDGTDYEEGIGTIASTVATMERTTVTKSKISGVAGTSKLNLSGTAVLSLTASAADILQFDDDMSLTSAQKAQGRENIYAAPFDALAYNGMQINGAMDVSQENGTTARTTGGYVVDGWQILSAGAQTFSAAQVADAPTGLSTSIKVTVTGANAAPASGDYLYILQHIEGRRSARLAFGNAAAQSVSIGFWTKIHRPGTYSGVITNLSRSYPFSFTQNVADTWEFKTVTIPGDVAGTWAGAVSTTGLSVVFTIAAGAGFAGPANAWVAAGYLGVTGTTNGMAATTDTFQITGVVVLPGIELPSSNRSALIMRPYDVELQLCRRYIEMVGMTVISSGSPFANTSWYRTSKRAIPTLSLTSGSLNGATVEILVLSPLEGFRQNALAAGASDALIKVDSRL